MAREDKGTVDYFTPIVEVAAGLFARKGYRGTSMRDIGRGMGIHAGSLYAHIETKEDLLEAVVHRIMEQSEKDMQAALAMGGTAREQLHEVAIRDVALIAGNREYATVFFHEWRNLSPERQVKVVRSRDRWEAGLREIIDRGVREGEFRPVDPRLASIAFASMLNWVYVWYAPEGDLSTDQLADQYVELLVDGLGAR
ncbi:MAG: TetR/AcrR family transcriptional regulator [Nocardioides sp.]|uniref:TetR/AcrR family transcriptional regulator n=1 Tax=Nocardioides sp. TaxID=35761 RepID=UPI0039E5FD60